MNPALRGVLLAKSDHPPKPARSAGAHLSKADTAIVVAATRAAIEARIAELERAVAKREEIRKAARQEELHAILAGILEIEEKVCKAERDHGGADRVPIRKMAGLTPAQQLAELNNRSALRKGLNGPTTVARRPRRAITTMTSWRPGSPGRSAGAPLGASSALGRRKWQAHDPPSHDRLL